ncbi:MAG: EAL domain-containing protein [Thermoanaerobaculia bacterium]
MSGLELISLSVMMLSRGVTALLMTALLWVFSRNYDKPYLRPWIFGWICLTIHYFAGAFALDLVSAPSADLPVVLAAATLLSAAGLLFPAFLGLGVWELAIQRPPRMRSARRLIITALVVGIVLPFAISSAKGVTRELFSLELVFRSALAAVVAGVSAWFVWRERARRAGPGFGLFSIALAVFGAGQFLLVVGQVVERSGGRSFGVYFAAIDIVLLLLLGLAMLVAVLEDEREAAVLAASEIEHLAYHDPLTGLPNRSLFLDRLIVGIAQSHRNFQKLAVLFLDLDRFKDINDSFGHSMGDAILRGVAARLRLSLREGDTVARFGGDEFTLILHRIESNDALVRVAAKILDTVRQPYEIGGREITVTTSIGISIYPDDTTDAETLIRNADAAMYRAKEAGRDNWQLYTAKMSAVARERFELETRLRRAVSRNELVIHYQPLVDMQTRAIAGFEALLRWQDPEFGLLWPKSFIAPAEESGLIVSIGAWVLREAARQARSWQSRGSGELVVAVNLSPRQFHQKDLSDMVRSILEETGLDPHLLELEITESCAMRDVDETIRVLRELKQLGVRISIDDFGTGYSSLSYLKQFPIDTIKIDRSFIMDLVEPGDGEIVRSVIVMAHQLGVKVIAEGVETPSQLEILKEQNCDSSQGFLFSAPLTAEEFERFVERHRQWIATA